ncbi:TetR family transcriptional regulator [Sphaerisporangium melleum]|uniref:TetR family transcriptional regulator n=1 Tax=Sphaerisporangium melleum TaxID=321316 RepID=A0A917RNV1_9ACTN|nr:TetR/AcrR family transcriptional regulator [Sphaerisporangium melleum]GGL15858.1 TetR family transcriptional regulator [Sphaerisporangium melleum]GII69634.1 TetR family transcriptional regulator [Sphaerisporangium melleum]
MTAPERSLRADARRNREAVLDAAARLFAQRGDAVQMDEIAERAGVGVGTLYRHFADKRALLAAIIGRRFEAMTALARTADEARDPWVAFETLLYGYLESAEGDAAFRFAVLGAEEPRWQDIAAEKTDLSAIIERIVGRAVEAGRLRADFRAGDFVLIARGAMANMTGADDWRRHVTLVLQGIRGPER